jgi:hypothetical protein
VVVLRGYPQGRIGLPASLISEVLRDGWNFSRGLGEIISFSEKGELFQAQAFPERNYRIAEQDGHDHHH